VPRVTGYHACKHEFATALREGKISIQEWMPSRNPYDWLGDGIYFWESSKTRARHWAEEIVGGEADVLEVDLELGLCLDLMDTEYIELLRETYDSLVGLYREEEWQLPENREIFPRGKRSRRQRRYVRYLDRLNGIIYPRLTGKDFHRFRNCELRYLDRLVINQFLSLMENGHGDLVLNFQTVRCAFEEGSPVYPGSMIRDRTHVQIAVRDKSCIVAIR
jgi:hypothetical protein